MDFETIAENCPWAICYRQTRGCNGTIDSMGTPGICIEDECGILYWLKNTASQPISGANRDKCAVCGGNHKTVQCSAALAAKSASRSL